MAFIMLASPIIKVGIVFWFVLLSLAVQAEPFEVSSAQVDKRGNGYLLNAEVKYSLTPRVMEAVENGVRVTFFQQIEIIRTIPLLGSYWQWNNMIWSGEIRYELRYHALSQQYVLQALDTDKQRNFPSLRSALRALGDIRDFTLPPAHLENTTNLILRIRSGLDLSALPTPMRPGALLSDKWQLTSPWVRALWK